ncbi:MAG: hypothetical protein L6R28_12675 [Planctomycetes bacterium]|nr:hypothetical protein [Planctomycetota bacterium]
MTNAPPKKRPWFQLHLSSCVVLMILAGAIVGANCLGRKGYAENADGSERLVYTYRTYGWPWDVWTEFTDVERFENGRFIRSIDRYEAATKPGTSALNNPWGKIAARALKNALVGLSILAVTALACEWIIRRRERARAAQEPAP